MLEHKRGTRGTIWNILSEQGEQSVGTFTVDKDDMLKTICEPAIVEVTITTIHYV